MFMVSSLSDISLCICNTAIAIAMELLLGLPFLHLHSRGFFFLVLLVVLPSTGSGTPLSSSPADAPAPTSTSPASSGGLDPKQVRALESLGVVSKEPCSHPPSLLCDNSKPFRHLLSLTLSNCSSDVSLSTTALKSLSTLQHLVFLDCPIAPIHFPPDFISSLRSFTCIHSLRRLTGVWLSKFLNLTDLTVSNVPISASGPAVILGSLKKLQSVTISHTNLTGYLPKWLHHNITHLDLSGNQLKGRIHSSITGLDNLVSLNLSSNQLSGEIPSSIGDLMELRNLSLASNSLSGPIPESLSAIPSLVHLDLSSNQLNGSVPGFLADMRELRYLNLESNSLQGVLPFNASFIKRLVVFKIGENSNLCYNHSSNSKSVKLGISPCDKNGLPMSPPAPKSSDSSGSDSDYSDSSDETTSQNQKSSGHHGPNKVVLGIAISLAFIVFLIIFLIFLSKRCA